MPVLRGLVQMPHTNALPEDVSVNNWYFRTPDTLSATFTDIATALRTFYTGIQSMYAATRDLAKTTITFYDMASPKPRPPLGVAPLGLAGTGGTGNAPGELSIVLTFHGQKVAGQRFARRRGRIYIGPLAGTGANDMYVPTGYIATLTGQALALKGTSDLAPWSWVVYSETQAEAPNPPNVFPDTDIVGGWVDNAWDIQRRRGYRDTTKTTWGSLPARSFEEQDESDARGEYQPSSA